MEEKVIVVEDIPIRYHRSLWHKQKTQDYEVDKVVMVAQETVQTVRAALVVVLRDGLAMVEMEDHPHHLVVVEQVDRDVLMTVTPTRDQVEVVSGC